MKPADLESNSTLLDFFLISSRFSAVNKVSVLEIRYIWEAINTVSAVCLVMSPRFSAEHCCERKWKSWKALLQTTKVQYINVDEDARYAGYKVARILVNKFEQTFARSTKGLLTPNPDLQGNSDEETMAG